MGKQADSSSETTVSTDRPSSGNAGPATGSKTTSENVTFDILRSALYHDLRQRKLSRVNRFAMFLNILFGSAAVAAFGAEYPLIGQVFGVLIAVIGAASIVWDFGGRSGQHGELKRRFYALLADAERGIDPDTLRASMTVIYGEEPPINSRDNRRAHNQAGESMFGDDFHRVRVGFLG